MELKVMILDDEFIILDGLISFPWAEYKCNVVATAQNGLEGLEKMKDNRPDIIISDIKMPGMNGLDFAKEAKKIDEKVTIIFISGYDNFEFVQEAIRVGVKDYLLKPVDYGNMKQVIQKVTDEIRANRDEMDYFKELDEKYHRAIPELRQKFASDLLRGYLQDQKDIAQIEASLGCVLEKQIVVVGRVHQINNICPQGVEPQLLHFSYSNIFEEVFGTICRDVLVEYDVMTMTYNALLIFQRDRSDFECTTLCESACLKLQKLCSKYCHSRVIFGISLLSEDKTTIYQNFRDAMIACDQGEYLKEEAIIQFFDIKDQYRKKIQLSEGQMQKIICDIINQDNEKVREDMERIFGAEEIAIESAKLVAMDIIMGCVKYPMTCFVFDNDIRQEWNFASLLEGFGKIDRFQNKDELTNFMVKTFELLMIQNHNDGD